MDILNYSSAQMEVDPEVRWVLPQWRAAGRSELCHSKETWNTCFCYIIYCLDIWWILVLQEATWMSC